MAISRSPSHLGTGMLAMLLAFFSACDGQSRLELTVGSSVGSTSAGVCGTLPAEDKIVQQGPLRRLTRLEYINSVADLVGVPIASSALVSDLKVRGFDANTFGGVTELMADEYLALAQSVAASAAPRLAQQYPCPSGTSASDCVASFSRSFGFRAWRRPLADEEVARLAALYSWARVEEKEDHAGGLRIVVAALLASPHFRYQLELGAEDGDASRLRLSQFELASRLSYFLWNSAPDQALLDAAATGGLASTEQLAQQARRMLGAPRAREGVWEFFRQWLEIEALEQLRKDPVAFPQYSLALASAMLQETQELTRRVSFQGPEGFSALFNSRQAYVTSELASLYGETLASGPGLVELDAFERAGVLTQASVLASHAKETLSSPVLRGQLIRARFLCTDIPPPPPNVDTSLPEPTDPNLSLRERLASHMSNPSCSGCHQLMDPIGFGFEEYDAIGRFRPVVNGTQVDASGSVTHTVDMNGAFRGAIELAGRLSQSEQVKQCFTLQWWSYGLGRDYRGVDPCSRAQALERLRESGGDVAEMIVGIVTANAFRFIRAEDP